MKVPDEELRAEAMAFSERWWIRLGGE